MDDIYISLSRACLHSYGGHFSDRLGAWAESGVGNMIARTKNKVSRGFSVCSQNRRDLQLVKATALRGPSILRTGTLDCHRAQ